jgi:hypothetical protein
LRQQSILQLPRSATETHLAAVAAAGEAAAPTQTDAAPQLKIARSASFTGKGTSPIAPLRKPQAVSAEAMRRRLTRTGSEVLAADFVFKELLGRGGEGSVFKAQWQGAVVAVKKWHSDGISVEQFDSIKAEVEVLRKVRPDTRLDNSSVDKNN